VRAGGDLIMQDFEILTAEQLAKKWQVPLTWVRNWSRTDYVSDPIPHKKLGRYCRYEWGSPELAEWWKRRRSQCDFS